MDTLRDRQLLQDLVETGEHALVGSACRGAPSSAFLAAGE